MRMARRHWAVALLAALGLHAGLAAAMLWHRTDPGATAAGLGGIEIALGPAGGAPGGPQAAPETSETDELPEAPVQETPEPARPVIKPEPAVLEDVETAAVPAIEKAPSPTPPPPEPLPAPQPIAAPHAPPPPVPATKVAVAGPEPSTAGADGEAGTRDSAQAGTSAADASAGGLPGAQADYAAVLLAWLERHKKYPRRAQVRRQEGVVLLFVVIDRGGRVLASRIDESSGHGVLDGAAMAMLERAKPLPPIPSDMPGDRIELVVPVQFFMS